MTINQTNIVPSSVTFKGHCTQFPSQVMPGDIVYMDPNNTSSYAPGMYVNYGAKWQLISSSGGSGSVLSSGLHSAGFAYTYDHNTKSVLIRNLPKTYSMYITNCVSMQADRLVLANTVMFKYIPKSELAHSPSSPDSMRVRTAEWLAAMRRLRSDFVKLS